MLIEIAQVGPLQANCYTLATHAGTSEHSQPCVVVDAGMEAVAAVTGILERRHLTVVAVLCTHGHLDHVADAARVAREQGVPVYIHPDDEHLLAHPEQGLTPDLAGMLVPLLAGQPDAPDDVRLLADGDSLELAGLRLDVHAAPGHTPGSVLIDVTDPDTHERVTLCGDVVFRGSIGRTDLPGGSPAQMADSLRRVVLPAPDDTVLLPGHGPATSVGAERRTNPYLCQSALTGLAYGG